MIGLLLLLHIASEGKMEGKILFVCTGNTCRSIIAQALFQKYKAEILPDLKYNSDSAGIAAIAGMPPTRETISCLSAYGIDGQQFRAKQVDRDLVKSADFVFVMTQQQKLSLKKEFPEYENRISLFKRDYNEIQDKKNPFNEDICDPYGKSLMIYRKTCLQIEKRIKNLLYFLKEVKK